MRGASVGLRIFCAVLTRFFSRALLAGLRLFTAFFIRVFFARGALIGPRVYTIALICCFLHEAF